MNIFTEIMLLLNLKLHRAKFGAIWRELYGEVAITTNHYLFMSNNCNTFKTIINYYKDFMFKKLRTESH